MVRNYKLKTGLLEIMSAFVLKGSHSLVTLWPGKGLQASSVEGVQTESRN